MLLLLLMPSPSETPCDLAIDRALPARAQDLLVHKPRAGAGCQSRRLPRPYSGTMQRHSLKRCIASRGVVPTPGLDDGRAARAGP